MDQVLARVRRNGHLFVAGFVTLGALFYILKTRKKVKSFRELQRSMSILKAEFDSVSTELKDLKKTLSRIEVDLEKMCESCRSIVDDHSTVERKVSSVEHECEQIRDCLKKDRIIFEETIFRLEGKVLAIEEQVKIPLRAGSHSFSSTSADGFDESTPIRDINNNPGIARRFDNGTPHSLHRRSSEPPLTPVYSVPVTDNDDASFKSIASIASGIQEELQSMSSLNLQLGNDKSFDISNIQNSDGKVEENRRSWQSTVGWILPFISK